VTKRTLSLFATILCLAACLAAVPAAAAPSTEKTITYSWPLNAGDINPHLYSPNQMYAQALVYEPLVSFGDSGKIEPCLAVSWAISDDGKAYTFTLRDGVTFSDGTPFDAAAAKKNFDTIMANAKRHSWLAIVELIEKTEAVDPKIFRLTLKAPYAPTLNDLSLIRPFRFLSPKAFPESGNTADGIRATVGTGPWVLAETKKGEYDVFVRNENYWGPRPFFDKIVVRVLPDPEGRVVAFETGEIDLIYGSQINIESFMRLKGSGQYATAVSGPMTTRAFAINSARGATKDLGVRRAIQHAVNRDAIVRSIFRDLEPRADFLFPTTTAYCDTGATPYEYDPAKAAKLLDDAGWKKVAGRDYREKDGKNLSMEVCFVGNDPLQKALAEVIQGDFRKVGIEAVLIGEERDSFYGRQKTGEFDLIFSQTWGAPYEPHAVVGSMRAPSHADYQAQVGLPMKKDLDASITKVLSATDEAERAKLYREILTTLHEQAVYLPLTYPTQLAVYSKKIADFPFSVLQYVVPFERMSERK
jgi:nickel transport system substrate-binding protein